MNQRSLFLLTIVTIVSLVMTGCDWPAPEQARKNLHLPEPGFVADAPQGKQLFEANCIRCHGKDAGGTRLGPPLVHWSYSTRSHPDVAFHLAVKNGVRQHHWKFGHMPPVKNLSPEQAGHIIAYVRKEQRQAGIK